MPRIHIYFVDGALSPMVSFLSKSSTWLMK